WLDFVLILHLSLLLLWLSTSARSLLLIEGGNSITDLIQQFRLFLVSWLLGSALIVGVEHLQTERLLNSVLICTVRRGGNFLLHLLEALISLLLSLFISLFHFSQLL